MSAGARPVVEGARHLIRSRLTVFFTTLISVGLLVAAVGGVVHVRGAFVGELRVRQGQEECLAVRKQAAQEPPAAAEHGPITSGVPGRAIAFREDDTARNWIDPEAYYDVAQLPFFVRLDGIEVLKAYEPKLSLDVVLPEGKETHPVALGEPLSLGGESVRVTEVRRWSGLLREESGRPMASVTLKFGEDAWSGDLFLMSGAWLRIGADIAALWQWMESQDAARAAAEAPLSAIGSARWGVVEGSSVNWFESFTAGAGIELGDKRSVTLLRLDEHHATDNGDTPAILVEIVQNKKAKREWILANAEEADSLVRFDVPAARKLVFTLYTWQENEALVAAYRSGAPAGNATLEAGDSWAPQGGSDEIRIEQALQSAVPVKAEDSPVFEAVAEADGRELRLRQGETVRLGDLLLRFNCDVRPPDVQYSLSLVTEDGTSLESFTLEPDRESQWEDWTFSEGLADTRFPSMAALLVRHPGSMWLVHWGMSVCSVGLCGFVLRSILFPKRKDVSVESIQRGQAKW